MRAARALVALAAVAAGVTAIAEPPTPPGQSAEPVDTAGTMARVRAEAAKLAGRSTADVDIDRPLGEQGLDDLSLASLVLALEEIHGVHIPDGSFGRDVQEWRGSLSVRKLAEVIVAQQRKGRDGRHRSP